MRRTTWFLVALPWILAALTAATLAWAIPRADDGTALDDRVAALQERVAALDETTGTASERAAALRDVARAAEEQRDALAARARRSQRRLIELQTRVERLRAQAAAEAAEEAGAQPETGDFTRPDDRVSPTPPPAGEECEGGEGEECPPA